MAVRLDFEDPFAAAPPTGAPAAAELDFEDPFAEAAPPAERPGILSRAASQLLTGEATELATAYATEINELRDYDNLPWYKKTKYPSDPAAREQRIAERLPELQKYAGLSAQYQREQGQATPEERAIAESKTLGGAFKAAAANPGAAFGLIAPSAASSLVDLPQTVAAGLTMGPRGAVAASGVSAGQQDYKASVLEALGSLGYNTQDSKTLEQALLKADVLVAAQEQAKERAMVVGGAAGLGTLVGGKMLAGAVRPGVGRELANVGLQIPAQAAIEGGGEYVAQKAAGQKYKPGEIVSEMLGGAVTAPVDVAQAAAAGFKESGPDPAVKAAADKARSDYLASVREVDDGEGGVTYVDAAGNAVGDTLDEVQLTASRLTPAEMQARMTPAAPAQEAAPAQPAPTPEATPAPAAQPAPASPLLRGKRQRVEPTIEPAAQTEPTDGIPRAPDVDNAGGLGRSERLPDASVGATDSRPVGGGTDIGRVSDVGDGRGGNAGSVSARTSPSSLMVAPNASDAALNNASLGEVVGLGVQTNGNKAPANSGAGTPQLLSDSSASQALQEKGLENLGVDEKRAVLSDVLSRIQDFQVLKSVVELIPVDVMNMLVGQQGSPKMLLDNPSVLTDLLSASLEAPVSRPVSRIVNAIASVSGPTKDINARTGAEGSSVALGSEIELGARPKERQAARITSTIDSGQGASPEVVSTETSGAAVSAAVPTSISTKSAQADQVKTAPQPAAAVTQETRDDVRNQERQEDGQQGREFARSENVRQGQAQAQGQEEVASAAASATPAAPKKQGAARLVDLLRSANKLDAKPEQYEDVRLTGLEGEAIARLGALFNKDVVVFRAKDGAPWKAGGALFPSDPSTLFINADSGAPATYVFMHEMTHSMKRTDPETWAKLEAAMRPLLKNKDRYQKGRLGGKALPEAIVTEEMIADMMAENASNPQFWSDLYGRFGDKSAWAQFVSFMRSFLERAIDTLYTIGPSNYVSDLNKAYEALVDAAYNHARAQHGDGPQDGPALEMPAGTLSSAQGSPPSQSLLDEGNAYWRAGANMWDNLNRVRILQDKAVQRGLQMRDNMNVWVRENLSRSKMRVMADKVTEDYQQPILDLMATNDLSLKQVDDYLYALHAPERNAAIAAINPRFPDGGSGMTNAEAASILAAFTPEQTNVLKQIAAKTKALQDYKLSVMEKYGLMEPADVARLRSMYSNYVPLKTIEEGDTAPGNTGRGLDIRGSEVKQALGRGSRATSPLLVSFQDMARTLVRAHKNEAGNALLELSRDPVIAGMQQNGKPIIAIANPADFARPVTDAQGQVSVGIPGNWWQNEEVFVAKENGVPRYIHVRDPELMAQLRRMGDAELGAALRAIGQGTRLFARMLTQYNPVFAPVNIIRDAIQASVLALGVNGVNPLKVVAAVPVNLGRIMANKARPNQRYKEFLEDGASTNAYGLNDLQDSIADIEALGISLGYTRPANNAWDKAWNAINAKRKSVARKRAVRTVFDGLSWWNEAFENAVRLSTYNAMRDAGYTREEAAFNSKELSTNFNKKGQLSAALNAAYVFVNAAMQGNRALVKFWKESPKIRAAFIGLVAAGVLQDVLGSLFGGEDDESGLANLDEVGDWALDHNIVLPTGDNSQVKIPLPYGLNLPFVMGRRVSRAIRTGEGMSQIAGILNVALDNFSPIGGFEPVSERDGSTNVSGTIAKTVSPSLLRPLVGVAFNANFMGAPIAKEPFQGDPSPAPRAYDFKPGTADYAVKTAEWLNSASGGNKAKPGDINVSPEHIQYLIGEYFGGAGRFVSDVTDISSKLSRGAEGDIDWAKAPFVRSFTGTDSRSDAYSRYREIRQGVSYLKDEKKAGEPLDPALVGVSRLVERTEDRLSDLRKRRKAAYAHEDMAMVRQIQDQETALIKAVVKQYNERKKAPAEQ